MSVTKIIPLLNRVLIQKIAAPKQSAGGIILNANKDTDLDMGTVVATGPGVKDAKGELRSCLVGVGQKVLLPGYGGQVVNFNEEKYFIYKDTEIVGIVN
jgi:chaperonin GroES